MDKTIDIFFDDLKEEKQQEVLKAFEIEKPEDMNWDVIPLTIVSTPEEE